MKKTILTSFLATSALLAVAQTYPYQDPSLSPHERAVDIVSRMTLEEKAKVMMDV